MLVLFLLMSVRIKSPERNPMSLLGLKCLCHVKKKKNPLLITQCFTYKMKRKGEVE